MSDAEALSWEAIGEERGKREEREKWLAAIDAKISEDEAERDNTSSKNDYYYHVARIVVLQELRDSMTGAKVEK